jgi:hypothetical protein
VRLARSKRRGCTLPTPPFDCKANCLTDSLHIYGCTNEIMKEVISRAMGLGGR